MKSSPNNKRFIVRKYIMAKSASDALKNERRFRPDEVFLDDEWMKQKGTNLQSAIGFNLEEDYEN